MLRPEEVKTYHDLANAKLNELDQTIGLRRAQGFDAGVAIVRNDTKQHFMDDMRRLTDQIIKGCNGVMATRRNSVAELSSAALPRPPNSYKRRLICNRKMRFCCLYLSGALRSQ
jgi:CHASE3 domain sensor protein